MVQLGTALLQTGSISISVIISVVSLITSLSTLAYYISQYKQQKQQLEEQRRQIANQEQQLETQQRQAEQQERQLKQQEEQLARYEEELEEISRQTELAELEHQAHLEVEDYEFDGDRVIVTISNNGSGPATDLALETSLQDIVSEQVTPRRGTSDLRRFDEEANTPKNSQSIPAGEQDVKFVAEAIVGTEGPTGKVHYRSFRGIFQDLKREGQCSRARLQLHVRASTLTEKEQKVVVTQHPLSVRIQDQPLQSTLEDVSGQHLGL